MRGKNGNMSGGPSIASELNMSMNNLFSDDPFIQGLAMFGNGNMLLSHTPPNFTPGSYEISHMKRARAGSISGRLRSASDLEEKGLIDKSQKGVLKDLIISGDSELQIALDLYDQGDSSQLEAMMRSGLLDRRDSLDLLQDLDFGIMDLGTSDSEIPNLPEGHVNSVMNSANNNNSNDRDHDNDKLFDGNDSIEIVRRKDSGGGGGDFGQSGGGVKGTGGDGVSTAGCGSDAGGGKAVASSMLQRGAAGECGGFESLRRGRSSLRKGAALNSIENHDSSGKRSFEGLQSVGISHAESGTAASTAPATRGGVIASGGYSEQEIDLGAGSADAHHQFDIGDMAFDAAFDYDGQEDDVDMREGTEESDPSSPLAKAHGATLGPTAVGPLRVISATQLAAAQARRSAQQQQQQEQQERLASSTQDDDGRDHHEGPGAMDADGSPQPRVVGSTEGSPLSDHHHASGEEHHHQHDDDHHSSVGVGVEEDDDAAVLASYGILDGGPTAPIGDFSPQFKFSFTDDIHLDLGSGLKDELADLDSLSEPLPEQQTGVKGGESYPPIAGLHGPGLAYRHYQHTQLLSRGGPVVKTEVLTTTSSSSDTASQTTVRLTSAARAAAAPLGGHQADVSAVMVRVGADNKREAASPSRGGAGGAGYANNTNAHVSSTSSPVTGRHTGHHHQYGTATSGGAGAAGQIPAGTPQGSVGGVGVGGSGAAGAPSDNGGRPHNGEVVSHSQQASPSGGGGAVRGRPVVSGMGVMVGGGPSPHHHHQRGGVGIGGGADGEERKFVGAYSPEARRQRIQRFLEKREHRVWTKMVKYDVRKNFADTRMRVKGRFVKKEDEALLREVMACA